MYSLHPRLSLEVTSCLSGVQLSKVQAEEAMATVKSLTTSGRAFCVTMHQQLDEATLACSKLPTAPVAKTPASATARNYVTKLPQLLSLSKLNLLGKVHEPDIDPVPTTSSCTLHMAQKRKQSDLCTSFR